MDTKKAAAALGSKGGKSGTGKAKARTSEQARAAAYARWKCECGNAYYKTTDDGVKLCKECFNACPSTQVTKHENTWTTSRRPVGIRPRNHNRQASA
jgi:hypothetical protein